MKVSAIKSIITFLLIMPWVLMLFSCAEQAVQPTPAPSSTRTSTQDGPPDQMIDVSTIPNAVPKKTVPSRYGNPESYMVFGKRYYVMPSSHRYKEKGLASWYGSKFHGKRTSSGESYNMHGMTAAHKTLPLPTYVKVTHLKNNRQVILKVNDRGPFHDKRIIDLSHTAAVKLGIKSTGTGLVEVEAINLVPVSSIKKTPNKANTMAVYLQLGVFSYLENAQKLSHQVNSLLALEQTHINKKLQKGQQKYYVRMGPFNNAEQVDQAAHSLSQKGITKHYIVLD